MRPMGRLEGPSAMMGKPPVLFAKKQKSATATAERGDGRARTLPSSNSEPTLSPAQSAQPTPLGAATRSASGPTPMLGRCQSASSTATSAASRLRQQETADAVDQLLREEKERKEELHRRAKEERQLEQTRRLAQRKMLTEKSQVEHQRFVRKMQESIYQQRSRMAKRLQDSPLTRDLVELQENAERSRGSPKSQRPASASSSAVSALEHQRVIQERVDAVDPLEVLRKERRRLLDRERELKFMMSVEKTRQRSEIAEKNRPNNTAEFKARKQMKEDEAMMKQEFMRLMSGWNGRKVKTRNKPVEQLWQEHKARLLSGTYFHNYNDEALALEDGGLSYGEGEHFEQTFDGTIDSTRNGALEADEDNKEEREVQQSQSQQQQQREGEGEGEGECDLEFKEEDADDERIETASQATIPKPQLSEALAETWTLP